MQLLASLKLELASLVLWLVLDLRQLGNLLLSLSLLRIQRAASFIGKLRSYHANLLLLMLLLLLMMVVVVVLLLVLELLLVQMMLMLGHGHSCGSRNHCRLVYIVLLVMKLLLLLVVLCV